MTSSPTRRRRLTAASFALLTATLVPGLTQLPALAASSAPAVAQPRNNPDDVVTLGDAVPGLTNLDTRGRTLPTASQRAAVRDLGASDVRWNQFGTPSSILPADGVLARATSGDPVEAARTWLRSNAAVFGLSAAQVDAMDMVNNQKFAQSPARAVIFRQNFGDLSPALDSMVTVGVANGEIAYVSSSLTKASGSLTEDDAELSPVQAWVAAAANVGREVDPAQVDAGVDLGWTRLQAPGFAQEQQVRLRSLAMADGTVRPVFEANVVDSAGGAAFAYTLMVDAVTGDVLHRENQVEHSNDAFQFQGSITATECGPKHPFEITDDKTRQIDAVSVAFATDDHVVKIFSPSGELLVAGDLGTSPETATYTADSIPAGIYSAQVCPYDGQPTPVVAGPYNLTVTTSDTAGGDGASLPMPVWRYFPANPTLNWSASHTPKNSVIGCWRILDRDDCSLKTGALDQLGMEMWDFNLSSSSPTFTTSGNNAQDREAWGSPLTPGGTSQAPVSPTREYVDEFTDAWNNSKCDPTNFHPGGNDILASTTNLFASHNRMHDYSYSLGFTEMNYNLQQDNRSKNPDPTRENDPEIGNVQAGAASGGAPTYQGRDNANQIALQDGLPGITNQYLFQPIAGAFYSPCADGALDMSIAGHEYTHAITNRMVGGADQGLTSEQGRAMGESWSDLVAAEYQFSHGYSTGTSPWVVGAYATGNKSAGIRDYPINKNPLNYGNYGFDSTGNEVHADGEIWNAAMWDVRQALVKRWDYGVFRYGNKDRQHRCAEGSPTQGPTKATRCPGNRRWVALMFDSFLLQQGATSMLDARDAFIAADRMRFENRKNQKPIWDAFAKRGMGKGARTPSADSGDTRPSFVSPKAKNATVSFRTRTPGQVFVGVYEARSTPVADTVKKSRLDGSVRLAPGRYQMLFTSKKQGFKRFTLKVGPGQDRTVRIGGARNLAAKAAGAKVIDSSAGSRNPDHLIDGTEATNWGGVNEDGLTNVDTRNPFVAVDLAGKIHRVQRVNVSAMLTPAPASDTDIPLAVDEDPDSGSRFTALRKFALEACLKACDTEGATWKRFFVSKASAFPGKRPRPVAPNLILRSFNVPDVRAAAIRLVAVENQCTGFKGYAGEQDNDPLNATDCKTASDRGTIVHAAELQVF